MAARNRRTYPLQPGPKSLPAKFKIGILGTCPVCEGEFKTHNGKMVHHGYLRPGTGSIHGDCFAVHYPAYEISPKGCEAYRDALASTMKNAESALETLPSCTYFTELVQNSWNRRWETLHYSLGVTEPSLWVRIVARRAGELRNRITECRRGIERMTARIEAWTAKPLREVTEAVATALAAAERAARAAERQAKKDAKKAKSDALQAKRDAKEEARRVHVETFVEKLRACTAKHEASYLAAEFRSKKNDRKYGYLYLHEYVKESDFELFLKFDLARPGNGPNHVFFNI